MFTYRISPKSISIILDSRSRVIPSTHMNYERIKELLKSPEPDLDAIRDLLDIPRFIALVTDGRVQVSNDKVLIDGEEAPEVISSRILGHLHDGLSIQPLTRFLNRVMENPDLDVRSDIFDWLESGDMPITNTGMIVAYKKVKDDYHSYHQDQNGRVFDHTPGNELSMPRDECDCDRTNTCSTGLHFCSYDYLSSYYGSNGRIVIVVVDPADVTAIPRDYNLQKGRTCRYQVIGEVPRDEAQDVFNKSRFVINKDFFGVAFNDVNKMSDSVPKNSYSHGTDDGMDNTFRRDNSDHVTIDTNYNDTDSNTNDLNHSKRDILVFTLQSSGEDFSELELLNLLSTKSQRQVSSITGIPRSTLQAWIKRMAAE